MPTGPGGDLQRRRSTRRHWALGLGGMVVGIALAGGLFGGVAGGVLGGLLASLQEARARLDSVEQELATLRSHAPETAAGSEIAPEAPRAADRPSTIIPPAAPSVDAPEAGSIAAAVEAPGADAPWPVASDPARPRRPAGPSPFAQALTRARAFFFGGNTVVRVGLLVLLVGITLLAKFAAENSLFPIEARLAFGALVGLGLVGFGFRQRLERPGFGMSLQGGGVAALYLITFFAFKYYGLIPSGLAFGLFVALAVSTVMLSLLQKSEPLVVIGSLGGFLAPVLASTGGGSHVALFSYYLVLVTAIGFVAWREAWRVPALVAHPTMAPFLM